MPFFVEAVDKLGIKPFSIIDNKTRETNKETVENEIDRILNIYKNHPSIIKIKENVRSEEKFFFKQKTKQDIEKEILSLDPKKATAKEDIPTKMMITTFDIVSPSLTRCYNNSKSSLNFPKSLKKADILPVHKKDEKNLS